MGRKVVSISSSVNEGKLAGCPNVEEVATLVVTGGCCCVDGVLLTVDGGSVVVGRDVGCVVVGRDVGCVVVGRDVGCVVVGAGTLSSCCVDELAAVVVTVA